ncbi:unnamed protein product, partial [Rotaria sp. Silwood2]
MQVLENEFKEALRTLTKAHNRAPNDADILHERAKVFEKLGKLDEALRDRRRAMQLGRSISETVILLEDRLRRLHFELLRKGETSVRHLKIGWIQDALNRLGKNSTSPHEDTKTLGTVGKANMTCYSEAVKEYRAAVEIDVEHLCPEAHALLALCQERQNDFLLAHEAAQNFYQMLIDFPDSRNMWKLFVQMIKNP